MTVVLERGGVVESRHRVHWALVDAAGSLLDRGGDPHLVTYFRSAAKPLQALPLVQDGAVERWGIPPGELALCSASHSGEERHVAGVRRLLERAGVSEEELACGPHDPMATEAARAMRESGTASRPIHNNCSGKHAGMLALARHHGWETKGYHLADHPVQRRMVSEVARWTGIQQPALRRGVDGCGVICFGLPLRAMALSFARLAETAHSGGEAPRAVLAAMAAHPFEVAGTGRLCTELIEATGGRVVAKVGAEGVYCAVERERSLGLALKVEDGARRAAEVALVNLLAALELVDAGADVALAARRESVVPNTRGEPAARVRVETGLPRGGPREGRAGRWERRRREESLPAMLRALVRVSGAVAARDPEAPRRELAAAYGVRDGGGDDRRIEEALVQSYLFVGFPGALNALGVWREIAGRAPEQGGGVEEPAERDLLLRGEEVCRKVYGGQYPALRRNVARLHPDLDRWMIREGYGKVLARPGLTLEERELCIVALLVVQGATVQLHSHLRGALAVGAAPERVEAVLTEVEEMVPAELRAPVWETWDRVRERRAEGYIREGER